MKKKLRHLRFLLPVLTILIHFNSPAQEYTLTTTSANIVSSKALIDVPGLSGNTLAIIVATPLGNTKTLNPNPTGAWYYAGKWNLFNSNHAVMIPGLTYKVQYFLSAGPNQFLHLVTQQNLGSEGSYIDNPALNNHPGVQFAIFQNHAPDLRAASHLNQFEAKTGYSASTGKWYITNTGGQPLLKGSAYNIVISSAAATVSDNGTPLGNVSTQACKCPASLPPNGMAGGDLTGTFPEPMVRKILGRPLSNTAPVAGQVLKWNGTEWTPSAEPAANTGNNTNASYTAGLGLTLNGTEFNTLATTAMWNAMQILGRDIMTTPPTVGQVLKWGGGAWYPADDNVGTPSAPVAPMQTFFKNANEQSPALGMNGSYVFANHAYTITVTKNSRLIVSGNFFMRSAGGVFDILSTKMSIVLLVNNTYKATLSSQEIPNKSYMSTSVNNYMLDLVPGTYSIQFRVDHPWIDGNVAGIADATYTSLILLTL